MKMLGHLIEEEIETILKGTCLAAGCEYEYKYHRGYPPVVNHEAETDFLVQCAEEVPDICPLRKRPRKWVGKILPIIYSM